MCVLFQVLLSTKVVLLAIPEIFFFLKKRKYKKNYIQNLKIKITNLIAVIPPRHNRSIVGSVFAYPAIRLTKII